VKKDSWYLCRTGTGEPAYNMALDEVLLRSCGSLSRPILRFYGWSAPAATFGYFQKIADIERLTVLRPLIRRPTGGGLVPHDRDWTYSLAVPPSHGWYDQTAVESYRRVHEWIQGAFSLLKVETELAPEARKSGFGQCFEGYEQFDLLWRGRKIAGAAQRRNKDGLLVQGSIQPPPIETRRKDWEEAMLTVGQQKHGVDWEHLKDFGDFEIKARNLAQTRYSQEAYNRKR
jgi:lipoate-protein ligase A